MVFKDWSVVQCLVCGGSDPCPLVTAATLVARTRVLLRPFCFLFSAAAQMRYMTSFPGNA